ncbi:MAG: hypothetical protein QXI19_04350 [Candidatus Caldarchaeum sp.]
MPREIYTGNNYVQLSTTPNQYVDLTGVVPTGEVYLLEVTVINYNSTTSSNVYAVIRSSSNSVLAPVLPITYFDTYSMAVFNCLLREGQKLSIAQTGTTGNVYAIITDGVRQYP